MGNKFHFHISAPVQHVWRDNGFIRQSRNLWTDKSIHAVPHRTYCKFKDEVGLYRDDGIAVCKATPREIEKIKRSQQRIQIKWA